MSLEDTWAAPNVYVGSGAKDVSFVGGKSSDAGQDGLVINGTRVSVHGTRFFSNSRDVRGGTTNTSDGVAIGSSATDVLINGVMSGPGNNSQRAGVSIANGATQVLVNGNDLSSNVTAGVLNNASSTASVVIGTNLS
ncbi:hypothetical protein AA103196_2258 [Ameyamaea chiangmaiensis NBRC 103196]|nr:hypothetical protein AA103196_2258 [Ameyamaea chiangmaiensis NBRC 103196]